MTSPPAQTKNPLTIIAIFAAIVEASALASLPFLKDDSQGLYTWFLIGFPPFLTLLFFVTLNFNYKVLYSPSDYSNENDFLKIAKGPAGELDGCNQHPTGPEPPPPPAATPAAPPPCPEQVCPGPQVRQEAIGGSRAIYIVDCQHFVTDEQLSDTISHILRPGTERERHLIILYRSPNQLNPVSVLLNHTLSQVMAGHNECVISAYDLDAAALTTLTRRLTSPRTDTLTARE